MFTVYAYSIYEFVKSNIELDTICKIKIYW